MSNQPFNSYNSSYIHTLTNKIKVNLMRFRNKINAIIMFGLVGLSLICVSLDAPSQNLANITSTSIGSSEDELREPWALKTHHHRFPLEVSSNGHDRRKGTPVEPIIDPIENLDNNSLRVFFHGKELPAEYHPDTRMLRFVMPAAFNSEITTRNVTVYYDLTENGIKQQPDYDPEWLTTSYDKSVIKSSWEMEYQAYLETNQISENGTHFFFQDEVVYTEDNITYYYDNGSQVVNYVILDEDTNTYYLYNQTAELDGYIFFNNITYTWYIYNATGGLEYTYVEGFDENIFLGASYGTPTPSNIEGLESDAIDWTIGNVKAEGSAYADYINSNGVHVRQTIDGEVYRGSPTIKYTITPNTTATEMAWGSALLDLNGTILFNGTYFDHNNISDLPELAGINDSEWDERYGTEAEEALNSLSLITEMGTIDVSESDFENASIAYLMADDTIDTYDLGLPQYKEITYNSAVSDYDLDFDDVMFIEDVEFDGGTLDGSYYLLVDGFPDKISFLSPSIDDGEIVKIYYRKKKYDVGDQLKVIPFLASSRYLALHDRNSKSGFAFVFTEETPVMDLLIEVWQEKYKGKFNYYVNISLNYNYWWFDPQGYEGDIHDEIDKMFTLITTYLDSLDMASVEAVLDFMILEAQGYIPDLMELIGEYDVALPIIINILAPTILHYIRKTGSVEVNLDVLIEGETLESYVLMILAEARTYIEDFIASGCLVNIDDPATTHIGSEGQATIEIFDTGTTELVIEAYDTNGDVIVESLFIQVEVDMVEFTIFMGVVALIIGVSALGIFVRHRRHKGLRGKSKASMTWFKLGSD